MTVKLLSAILAVALVVAFLLPVVIKLKDFSLAAVVLIGLVLMLIDLVQSLRAKDD